MRSFPAGFPARVTSQGKHAGITTGAGDDARARYRQGYRFMSIGGLPFRGQAGPMRDLKDLRETCR